MGEGLYDDCSDFVEVMVYDDWGERSVDLEGIGDKFGGVMEEKRGFCDRK